MVCPVQNNGVLAIIRPYILCKKKHFGWKYIAIWMDGIHVAERMSALAMISDPVQPFLLEVLPRGKCLGCMSLVDEMNIVFSTCRGWWGPVPKAPILCRAKCIR